MARTAQTPPSHALPLGLLATSNLVQPIHRPDRSLFGIPGSSVSAKLQECRSQSSTIGPPTSKAPLGQRRYGR